MKGDKGITLISMAITIIFLIILAGVTIRELTKEDSLIPEAKRAKTQQDELVQNEEEFLEELKNAQNSQVF